MVDQYKDEINWKRVVWLIATSRRFRSHFKGLIFYALINHEEKRGDCASDAMLFSHYYIDEIITSNDTAQPRGAKLKN